MALLFCGCQQKTAMVAPRDQLQQTSSIDENDTDLSCSYFYFLWGRHAELLLQFDEALEAYEKALICDPEAEFINEKVPLLLLRQERTDEAANWLQTYLATHPDKTGMRMLYAKVLVRQKKTAQAMQQYQQISDLHPNDPAILLLLAEMYLNSNQLQKTRQALKKVLALDKDSYPGHVLMARYYRAQDEIDEAVTHYQKALTRNWSSDLQMELGELYIKAARYDKAVVLYKDIIEREEHNASARVALVHVYLLQKKDNLALAELTGLKMYVDQPQRVDLTIARLYAKQKQYDKAIFITSKILEKENLPEARYLIAVLFLQQKQYDRALKEVQQIDRKASEYSDGLFLRVRILRELNRLDEAIQILEKNINAVDIRNAEMFLLLAALHQMQGQDELSKKVLLQGLEAYPDEENLLYEYALLLENSGDHTSALQIMQKIIDLKPDNAAALNFVGYSWADRKVYLDKALDYIQRAIALKPENGYIRDSLGWVYYRLGKIDQAIKELEMAVKLSPDDPAILEHLGDVYLESGQMQQALKTYKKAVTVSIKNSEEYKRLLEKIAIIEKQAVH
jgi:tetratricopeptide (TPR) repeat protein